MRDLLFNGKKLISIALTGIMLVPLLAGCSFGGKASDKEERVLRIATSEFYEGEDEYFRQQFTNIFEFNNPNIKIEIISVRDENEKFNYYYGNNDSQPGKTFKDPIQSLQEMIEGPNPPDLIAMSYDQMSLMLEKNLLTPLDSKIAEDKFDTTDYVPAVYEGIKSLSPDGKMYALAPIFNSSALIYNKKLFADAGVEPPSDNMTWDEVFALAERVSKPDADKPLYGFSFTPYRWGDAFEDMNVYSNPLQLRYFDEAGEKMTVDTPEWEKVWNKLTQLQKDKITPSVNEQFNYEENSGPFSHDRFMSGRVAMSIINYGQLGQIIDANKSSSQIKDFTPIDFDVVTIPSHPENPGVVPNFNMSGLMGISSKATNPEDAWKLIKFINSPEWAKIKAGSSYELAARKSYIKPKNGETFNIEAFYNVKPSSFTGNDYYRMFRDKPGLRQALNPGQSELMEVLAGNKSVKDGLKSWQEQGDSILQQIKANPNGPITGSGDNSTSGVIRVR